MSQGDINALEAHVSQTQAGRRALINSPVGVDRRHVVMTLFIRDMAERLTQLGAVVDVLTG